MLFEPESVVVQAGPSSERLRVLNITVPAPKNANLGSSSSSEEVLKPHIVRESTFKIKEKFELAAEIGDLHELIDLIKDLLRAKRNR